MQLHIDGIADNQPIPERFAFGVQDDDAHVRFGENRNPAVSWSGLPDGTQSLVLICVDTDVPTRPDDVNQEGRTVPASLPRANFYHWVVVDIPVGCAGIREAESSEGVTARGKVSPAGPAQSRQGRNDYTAWFEGDAGPASNCSVPVRLIVRTPPCTGTTVIREVIPLSLLGTASPSCTVYSGAVTPVRRYSSPARCSPPVPGNDSQYGSC